MCLSDSLTPLLTLLTQVDKPPYTHCMLLGYTAFLLSLLPRSTSLSSTTGTARLSSAHVWACCSGWRPHPGARPSWRQWRRSLTWWGVGGWGAGGWLLANQALFINTWESYFQSYVFQCCSLSLHMCVVSMLI
jgi:hypothetical protein